MEKRCRTCSCHTLTTRFASNRDYGGWPVGPDPDLPWYGPGYRLDWPDTTGTCATCHAPVAASDQPFSTRPDALGDPASSGVTCDFCHKVAGIHRDPTTGRPYPNRPAALSYSFHRPPDGHQYFASPNDDPLGGGSNVPLLSSSDFCAPCHYGEFKEVVIYGSYAEWLESDYSDPESGRTCQDCHMRPSPATRFARADRGGRRHPAGSFASHDMSIEPLLLTALEMVVQGEVDGETLKVEVRLSNRSAGHHVPTGSPLRHVILLVEAVDRTGDRLPLRSGPVLPDWCGEGDPASGAYAGLPGQVYAKVLENRWTGEAPTAATWVPTRLLSDNRIAAHATDVSRFRFDAPASGDSSVRVRLLYRRAFHDLAEVKGWDLDDVPMHHRQLTVSR